MKKWLSAAGVMVLIAGVVLGSSAQRRRDPLTDAEVDQLRDAAQDAQTRMKLFVDFARDRMNKLEQAASDPKAKDRASQIHDRLQDFLDVYDELNDNLDNFEKRGDDLRKPLKVVLDADTQFQQRLRALRDSLESHPEDTKDYEFLLGNATDTVQNSLQDHHEMQKEQEAAKHQKK
jgi:hypothetical protein